ncbi:AAA family ATPase [bacterium endosymbiont of Escarpia laminata]|nr:MAG: AAA family ATPase [bacterium endosymbiont of Escarpia laminata]
MNFHLSGISLSTLSSLHVEHELCALWVLRMLLDLGAWKCMRGYPNKLTSNDELLLGLGLGEYIDREMTPLAFHELLCQRRAGLAKQETALYRPLEPGMRRLGETFWIDEVEQSILVFAGLIHEGGFLDDIADTLGMLNSNKVILTLSVLLGYPKDEVNRALAKNGYLNRSGLIRIDYKKSYQLRSKLEPLAGITDMLFDGTSKIEDLLATHYTPALQSDLELGDYPHLKEYLSDLQLFLDRSISLKRCGVNVLLYGPPGTGKSELARVIAESLGSTLYEVSSTDEDGAPLGGPHRLRAYQLAQHCLSRRTKALVLLDEVEDVFDDHNPYARGFQNEGDRKKGYMNRLLESNPVPAFWVTNNISAIDPAFRRRFDFALELPIPPRGVRRQIAEYHLGKLPVRGEWLDALARHDQISPAILGRAAKVAEIISEKNSTKLESQLIRVIGAQLKVTGRKDKLEIQSQTVTAYQPELLNPDRRLEAVVKGLMRFKSGRLCLYGPPGTGKSVFAEYLAEQMEQPLLLKRASDLLGSFVGETETNITNMFREAEIDQAVLLLDEADSFLRDRRGAQHSWEITQVNELLTQMEAFKGVFICTTNLVDELDTAAARRFDYKIKLSALTSEQRWVLFRQVIKEQGVETVNKTDWMPRLKTFAGLTPGHFATAIRQSRIEANRLSAIDLFNRLNAELAFNEHAQHRPIGYMATI